MQREFTASVYLIEQQRVLLLFHPKLQKWLPPGGHLEKNETPAEAAKREVWEETGYCFEYCLQENVSIDCWNAKSIERPYLCLLEEIPPYKDVPAHQHVDFVFVGRPICQKQPATLPCRWFSKEELLELRVDQEIFQETLKVIAHLHEAFEPIPK